jgi:hypothetical protein
MSLQFEWLVQSLQCKPEVDGLENAVMRVIAIYKVTAEDGAFATQMINVPLGPVFPEDFTPFESLTKEQVIGWIEAALGDDLDILKVNLEAQLELARAVPMYPPWVEQ